MMYPELRDSMVNNADRRSFRSSGGSAHPLRVASTTPTFLSTLHQRAGLSSPCFLGGLCPSAVRRMPTSEPNFDGPLRHRPSEMASTQIRGSSPQGKAR
jgi:hypothetical protein